MHWKTGRGEQESKLDLKTRKAFYNSYKSVRNLRTHRPTRVEKIRQNLYWRAQHPEPQRASSRKPKEKTL